MPMSDWISDVCSSDLLVDDDLLRLLVGLGLAGEDGHRLFPGGHDLAAMQVRDVLGDADIETAALQEIDHLVDRPGMHLALLTLPPAGDGIAGAGGVLQIGRASCRERGVKDE